MSKLLEKLKQVSEGKTQPMGFGAARRAKSPSMVLVATLLQGDASTAAITAQGNADAVLVFITDLAKEGDTLRQITDIPWGVSLPAVTKENVAELAEMGCDFLIFEEAKTPSAILHEETMGKVLQVDPSLSDSLVRALDRLPIDAVLIGGGTEETSLSVHRLMVCQRFANLVRKPLLTQAPGELPSDDLEALWETGVRGILVDIGGEHPEQRLSQVRQAIKDLPPATKRPREKIDAIVPLIGEWAESAESEEEDED